MRLAIVLLAACAHTGTPEPPPAASCEQAAGRLVGFLDEKGPEETKAVIRGVVSDHCKRDGWTPDARTCFADAKTGDDLDRCGGMMSPEQLAAIQQAGDQLATPKSGSDGAP